MTLKVDFYILESNDEQSRMKTVCRLADKVQRMGHKILVLTADSNQSTKLDELMWTYSQSSFLPHAIFDESQPFQDQQPVLIHHQPIRQKSQVLINLQQQTPDTSSYQRLVEIVNQNELIRNAGRQKYRAYKDMNFEINTHKIAA